LTEKEIMRIILRKKVQNQKIQINVRGTAQGRKLGAERPCKPEKKPT